MMPVWQSVLFGAGGLWVALALSMVLAGSLKRDVPSLAGAVPFAAAALAIQALHFAEEFATGFHRRFFPMLGQAPWPDWLFVAFNSAWIACWAAAISAAVLGRWSFAVAALFWFLGLAAIANGIAHPLLAIVAGGYFPGLATSPVLGLAGVFVVRRLLRRRD
jgi:Protein of unknown function with HXXEE motif